MFSYPSQAMCHSKQEDWHAAEHGKDAIQPHLMESMLKPL